MVVPYYGGRANTPPSRGPAGYEFDPRAFMQGARKWWPDTQRVAGQMWAGLPHLGAQVVGAEPAGPAATFMRQTMMGPSYAALLAQRGPHPSATPEQIAGAGKQAARYAAGYLDPATLTKRWTTHPGQVTADLAPLAAGPADLLGEAGLSALPTAARVALRGARAASYVASPATAPLAALGAGARGAGKALRGPVTDAEGAFTPAAVKAGQQAGLSPVDLEHPDFKPIYQQTLKQKGVTKAAAQEAIARYHSPNPQAQVSRQMVTERTSPAAAQPKTTDLIAQAKTNNGARAQQLAGPPGPSPEEAAAEARASAASAPGKLNPGGAPPAPPTAPGEAALADEHAKGRQALADEHARQVASVRQMAEQFSDHPEMQAHAQDAEAALDAQHAAGQQAIDQAHAKAVTGLRQQAGIPSSVDPEAHAISFPDLVDHHVNAALDAANHSAGDFASYPSSYPTAPGALGWLQGNVQKLAEDDNLTASALGKTHDELSNLATAAKSPTDAAAINAMKDGLQNATNGRLASGRVTGADPADMATSFGAADKASTDAAAAQARRAVLTTNPDGTLAMPTDRIRTFLDTPEGQAAFPDPLDRSNVNILAAHNDMITAPPSGSPGGGFWPGVRKLGAMGVGALATRHVPVVGQLAPVINAGVGAFTGAKVEDWVEKGVQGLQKGAAGRGAPTPGGPLVNAPLAVAGAAAPLAQAGPYVTPVASRTGGPPPPPPAIDVPTDIPPAWKEQPLDDPAPTSPAAAPATTAKGKAPRNDDTPTDIPPAWKEQPLDDEPAPQADGGRVGFAAGGQVIDMTERLLQRAEGAQKAAQASTKPLLGLSDATVAQALRVAQRGL